MTLPITYYAAHTSMFHGARAQDIEHFYPGDPIRQAERASIRVWMEGCRPYLTRGRVLDFGAGNQPYRDLVGSGAEYVPYDKGEPAPREHFDAIICTQAAQYFPDPGMKMLLLYDLLALGGYLLISYPTNWDVVEEDDLFRFTKNGMEHLLRCTRFEIVSSMLRAQVKVGNFCFPLGYGTVARRV